MRTGTAIPIAMLGWFLRKFWIYREGLLDIGFPPTVSERPLRVYVSELIADFDREADLSNYQCFGALTSSLGPLLTSVMSAAMTAFRVGADLGLTAR
jgi:hypothetical protein